MPPRTWSQGPPRTPTRKERRRARGRHGRGRAEHRTCACQQKRATPPATESEPDPRVHCGKPGGLVSTRPLPPSPTRECEESTAAAGTAKPLERPGARIAPRGCESVFRPRAWRDAGRACTAARSRRRAPVVRQAHTRRPSRGSPVGVVAAAGWQAGAQPPRFAGPLRRRGEARRRGPCSSGPPQRRSSPMLSSLVRLVLICR